jgi:hypothetical protein
MSALRHRRKQVEKPQHHGLLLELTDIDGTLAMTLLLSRCPETGSYFSTGIWLDELHWNQKLKFFAYTRCPICQVDHEWSERDVRLSPQLDTAA